MNVSLIVAASENNVIGKDNAIPWHLPDDLKFFRAKTEGHPVIMGRKCYESIGKPLPNRENIVVTHRQDYHAPGCEVSPSVEEAILYAGRNHPEEIFVIGGGEIYRQALPVANRIYMTRVHADILGNVLFPEIDPEVWKVTEKREHPKDAKHAHAFTFLTLERTDELPV
ncbi:dihydrofolate reductase [Candidatus Peregrinibacteria bacterium]|nr:dihydrofolate reductase [Candidatus Peregrinibacteria bacterium]